MSAELTVLMGPNLKQIGIVQYLCKFSFNTKITSI
jgi:hypothetical protein